jgi:NitT/TauT family transport system substrate-binding protein
MPANQYFPAMAQAIVASDSEIKSHPDLLRAVVGATLAGMKSIMDDPAAAATAFADASPTWKGKEELLTRIFANFVKRTYDGQKVLGQMDPDRLAKLQAFYLKQGIVERATPVADLYTNQFIQK